ncbi:aldehyde dehydrogenase family protein [Methylobacter sp. Wu1]|jgi:acyl-CoA reductase-like NAD-dependent aldehyde dehydrogenase|uniref:aldehyde dehydrogenase family protein n=1 Tax=Methylobacter sp. Wu1 TaxID=3119359 RepID=UPI002F9216EE
MSERHHARGGNSPFVVLGDADVDLAVRAAVFGRFLHQGQMCMSINGIIVDDSLHDAFAERFVEHVRGLKASDPNDIKTAMGSIVCARNEDDALRLANATDYGPSSAAYCGELERGVRFAQAVEAGMTRQRHVVG